ncbi:recombinase family protein [bacterium]|nr:recombinase family protein [bacterium]
MRAAYSYIRFSTPEQAKGDSLRRQLAATNKFVEGKDLMLDSTLNLRDLGVSGRSNTNILKGAFGGFLKAIETGRVKKGSVLIVESLDRITRSKLSDATGTILQIINSGVDIVTLFDGKEYTKVSIDKNPGDLMMSVCILARASEEVETKSIRLQAAWEQKRKSKQVLTKRCPGWLYYDSKKKSFVKDIQRVKVLKRIFKERSVGTGKDQIARKLNKKGEAPWGRGNGWHASYVQKILSNRSVLGEFQPHRKVNGKRFPVGEPISGYFPAVISASLFNKVQALRKANAGIGGKRAVSQSNLFSNLAVSGYTNCSVVFVNKGQGSKGGKYLVSDFARRGLGEKYASWRYEDFEISFLTFIYELDFGQVLAESNVDEFSDRHESLEQLQVENARIEKSLTNLLAAVELGDGGKPKRVIRRMHQLEMEKHQNEVLIEQLKVRLQEEVDAKEGFKVDAATLKRLIRRRQDKEVRHRLFQEIRRCVDSIKVYFTGLPQDDEFVKSLYGIQKYDIDAFLESFRSNPASAFQPPKKSVITCQNLKKEFGGKLEHHEKSAIGKELAKHTNRFFLVRFKNGATRYVEPNHKRPEELNRSCQWGGNIIEMQVVQL